MNEKNALGTLYGASQVARLTAEEHRQCAQAAKTLEQFLDETLKGEEEKEQPKQTK